MANLGEIIKKLESSKVTERQEGLNGIRTVFSKNSLVRTFNVCDDDGEVDDRRSWTVVFNALFSMVRTERVEYGKAKLKGTEPKPAVVKRLTDSGGTVRWLVERAARYFGNDVMEQVLHHLRDGILLRGEILVPIALDYAKAIKCILSFGPHLDHLLEDDWVKLVELAFNVVLGDPPKAGLDEGVDGDEFSMHVEPEEEGEEEEDVLPSHGKRKRGTHQMGPSQSFSSRSQLKPRGSKTRQISVSLEQVEFVSILSILLSYPGAPLLSSNHPYLPQAILSRLQKFLTLYPADSSLLYDFLLALSATLDHLALNWVKDTQKFARNSWDALMGLWNTKDKRIKEHLIVAIRLLLPYLTADLGINSVRDSYDQASALWKLYSVLEGEADYRRGIEGLVLDSLRLEIGLKVTGDGTAEPFVAHTFRAGWNFDTAQAASWVVLETQADCVAKVRCCPILYSSLPYDHQALCIIRVYEQWCHTHSC